MPSRSAPAGKNIQNEGGAVNDPSPQQLFQIALLGPGEFVVHNHQVDLLGLNGQGQLLGLAAADIGGAVRLLPALQRPVHHHGAGGIGQGGQLVQRILAVHRDEQRSFRLLYPVQALDSLGYPLVGQLNFPHPLALGHPPRLYRAEGDDGQRPVFRFSQKGGADAGNPASDTPTAHMASKRKSRSACSST